MRRTNEIHWSLIIFLDNERLLSLSWNEMAGLASFTEDQEKAIRLAAEHLRGFLGPERRRPDQ